MFTEIGKAYQDALEMLEDGLRKTPDECWRTGADDYLIPARIAYHILKGLEWLTNDLPREEFLASRRFRLDWLGPVEPMPDRAVLLEELQWVRSRVLDWLLAKDPADSLVVEKALYHLRHVQQHIGEYGIIARLGKFSEPEWK